MMPNCDSFEIHTLESLACSRVTFWGSPLFLFFAQFTLLTKGIWRQPKIISRSGKNPRLDIHMQWTESDSEKEPIRLSLPLSSTHSPYYSCLILLSSTSKRVSSRRSTACPPDYSQHALECKTGAGREWENHRELRIAFAKLIKSNTM